MTLEKTNNILTESLKDRALWVRKETLKIHKLAQETRVASSMSCVEILVALYYGKILDFDAQNLHWEGRDRFIVSKGHGSISLYPILADMGYFDSSELKRVCKEGTFLGGIPDTIVPGYETINGSLGHGAGVGSGMALALKRKGRNESVFVLLGDGELNEGSIWEAIMFASHHKLDNLVFILDYNKICMLGYCKDVIDIEPIEDKFKTFGWHTRTVDGHDVIQVHSVLKSLKEERQGRPKILIADTVKGKGAPSLEDQSLNHVMNIKPDDVDDLLRSMK